MDNKGIDGKYHLRNTTITHFGIEPLGSNLSLWFRSGKVLR